MYTALAGQIEKCFVLFNCKHLCNHAPQRKVLGGKSEIRSGIFQVGIFQFHYSLLAMIPGDDTG